MPQLTLRRDAYKRCTLCARRCKADRTHTGSGYCRSTDTAGIASVCLHRGEEPVLGGQQGVCNVFFAHCNLQCVYCQNHQISSNDIEPVIYHRNNEQIFTEIKSILNQGVTALGFVSPTHFLPHVKYIIEQLRQSGYEPVTIWNTNAYEPVDTLRSLEDYIDIYLPDLKYMDSHIAYRYSGAKDYPVVATAALKEMYRQKGANIRFDDRDVATGGLIIRHLILPNNIQNSLEVLRFIAFDLSPRTHISLMAQYHPIAGLENYPELQRTINQKEWQTVVAEMEALGMTRGWIQSFDSAGYYNPDFDKHHPFEYE
ncbi:MAG: 4Fe-4S cluster-binding domain-containing protein [Bacteroidales bacterium]|nr:4Fe-4S cluster-binding domain-containing protein [Bacteroidales bacterium]